MHCLSDCLIWLVPLPVPAIYFSPCCLQMTLPPKDEAKADKGADAHRLLALDLLACVCVDLQQQVAHHEHPVLQFASSPPPRVSEREWAQLVASGERQEDYACTCLSGKDVAHSMLDCDDCHKWFHFVCVGVQEDCVHIQGFSWRCHSCELRRWAEKMHANAQLHRGGNVPSVPAHHAPADVEMALAPPTDPVSASSPASAGKKGKKGKAAAAAAAADTATRATVGSPNGPAEPAEDDASAPWSQSMVLRHAVLHAVRHFSQAAASSAVFDYGRQYALCQWTYDALVAWQHGAAAAQADVAPAASSPGPRAPAASAQDQREARAELRRLTRLAVAHWAPLGPTATDPVPQPLQLQLGRPAARQLGRLLAALRPVAALGASTVYRPLRPHAATLSLTVSVVLKTLRDDAKPAFRTKALKVLAEVLDGQPALLRDRQVKTVVFDAFKDTSVSVRYAPWHKINGVSLCVFSHPHVVHQRGRDRLGRALPAHGLGVGLRIPRRVAAGHPGPRHLGPQTGH